MYGYCMGKTSSRKIEKATWEDVAYRVLAANQNPDHDSIPEFRKRHLSALAGLFVQVLLLCQEAGLVKPGHVAIDGSKVKANPSKHKAMKPGSALPSGGVRRRRRVKRSGGLRHASLIRMRPEQAGAGRTRSEGSEEFHRRGVSHHVGWSDQELRAGLQRPSGRR